MGQVPRRRLYNLIKKGYKYIVIYNDYTIYI